MLGQLERGCHRIRPALHCFTTHARELNGKDRQILIPRKLIGIHKALKKTTYPIFTYRKDWIRALRYYPIADLEGFGWSKRTCFELSYF